jgi:hypothetical protein
MKQVCFQRPEAHQLAHYVLIVSVDVVLVDCYPTF